MPVDFQAHDTRPQSRIDFQPHESQTGLQRFGQNHPFIGSLGATVAQGGTDLANGIREFIPGMERDPTNYYDKFGVKPNMATEIGAGLISAAPYLVAPEAVIPRIAALGETGLASLLGRAGVRGASGVAENEANMRGKGYEPSGLSDVMSAGLFAGTGAVSDILPAAASKIVSGMQNLRKPEEAIIQGQRQSAFPDVGNIVDNPAAAQKWNETTQGLFSPAKEIQEEHNVQSANKQYEAIQGADKQAMDLYNKLKGENDFHEDVAAGLIDTHKNMANQSTANYEALAPELKKIRIDGHPNAQSSAHDIIVDAENNQMFGVTDKELKNDIVQRAQNALELKEANGYPIDLAIKEERNLKTTAADLKSRGDNAAARYYETLAKGYEKDINSTLLEKSPETHEKLMAARDFHKNNVIPFRESSQVRKMINNNFDEEVSPRTISNLLTSGKHDQLLKVLPQNVKDKIFGDLMYNKVMDATGNFAPNPSLKVAKKVNSVNRSQLDPLIQDEAHRKTLSDIANTVRDNKKVLGDLSKPTKTVDGASPGMGAVLSSSGTPHGIAHIGSSLLNSPTAPFWTKLLANEKNPELLSKVLSGEKVSLEDIRKMTTPKTKAGGLAEILSVDPRTIVTNIGKRPNYVRAPLVVAKEAATERKKKEK